MSRERDIYKQPPLFEGSPELSSDQKQESKKVSITTHPRINFDREIYTPELVEQMIIAQSLRTLDSKIVTSLRESRSKFADRASMIEGVGNSYDEWQLEKCNYQFLNKAKGSGGKKLVDGTIYPHDWVEEVWFSDRSKYIEKILATAYLNMIETGRTEFLPVETNPENSLNLDQKYTANITFASEHLERLGYDGVTVSRHFDYVVTTPHGRRVFIRNEFLNPIYDIDRNSETQELLDLVVARDQSENGNNFAFTGLGGYGQAKTKTEIRRRSLISTPPNILEREITIPRHRIIDVRNQLTQQLVASVERKDKAAEIKKINNDAVVLPFKSGDEAESGISQKGLIYLSP